MQWSPDVQLMGRLSFERLVYISYKCQLTRVLMSVMTTPICCGTILIGALEFGRNFRQELSSYPLEPVMSGSIRCMDDLLSISILFE